MIDADMIPGMPSDRFADLDLRVRGDVDAWAVYSSCELYRYVLGRSWDLRLPTLVICALNPSTATELVVDPTIRRELAFAKRDGFGVLIKVNAYALRATDPKELERSRRRWDSPTRNRALGCERGPTGDHNDEVIRRTLACLDHFCVVAAWGRGPSVKLRPRFQQVFELLRADGSMVHCYGKNADGSPKHPLYLPSKTRLEPWPVSV